MTGVARASTAWLLALARRRHASTLDQRIAFSALQSLHGPSAHEWQRTFLAHADIFALGASAPRNDFCDWRCQVLYPRDGYWGGAPSKAALWFRNLHGALKRAEWSNAAYSAGVLSAYLAAVADPFNTVRSDAGDTLHEPWRRSVLADYTALLDLGRPLASTAVVLADGNDFLVRALGDAATAAAARFETALAHYDLQRGVVVPEAGFDSVGRQIAAERLAAAVSLVAAVLERALVMSSAEPAASARIWPRAAAWTVALPLSAWRRAGQKRADTLAIALMFDEVQATGGLDRYLPESARAVRDLWRTEVEAARVQVPIAQVFPFPERPRAPSPSSRPAAADTPPAEIVPIAARIEERRAQAAEPAQPATPAPQQARPIRAAADESLATEAAPQSAPQNSAAISEPRSSVIDITHAGRRPAVANGEGNSPLGFGGAEVVALADRVDRYRDAPAAADAVAPQTAAIASAGLSRQNAKPARGRDPDASDDPHEGAPVTPDDDVIRAPSVGVRTALDLRRVGVDTLDDFARVHPIALVARLEDTTLDPDVVEIWQQEVRLMLAIPGLTGSEARLFVGAGFPDRNALLDAEMDAICAALLRYALSPDGAGALIAGPPPSLDTLRALVERVRAAA